MKPIRLFVLFITLTSPLAAQTITGKLTTTSHEIVPFANVLLITRDSTLVKGTQTSETGTYTIPNVTPGQYILRITAIGYKIYNTNIIITAGLPYHAGTHQLEVISHQLQEITVRADKPLVEQQADRTVVNVESSVLSQGSSAMQVLERSPGITRDPQTNSLSLNGKSNVAIMINGKLMRIPADQVVALLNGMSANDIQTIEILTTPPSRYDAEGDAGMINIVTKKNTATGTSGTFSITGGYGWKKKAAAGVNLTHNTKTLHTYATYAYLHDHTTGGWHALSTQTMPAFGGDMSVDFRNNEKAIANSHNVTLGLEVERSGATWGTAVTYAASHTSRSITNHGHYTIHADSVLPMVARIDGNRQWKNIIASVFLQKPLRENEAISINADYLGFTSENPTDIKTTFFDPRGGEINPPGSIFANRQRSIADAPIHVGIVKADYNRQIKSGLRIEAGIKTTLTRSTCQASIQTWQNGAWINTSRTENNIRMKEGIAAAYAALQWQLTPAVNMQAGLRYEYSRTQLIATQPENTLDRKIGKLFPTLFVTKQLNEQTAFQLVYGRRISRPSYSDLGSYIIYNDPMSVETGNPALRPTLTDNIKLGYSYSGYAIALLASNDRYPIVRNQLSERPERDLMYVAPQNMAWQKSLSLQTTLPFKAGNRYTMNVSVIGSIRRFRLHHTQEQIEKTYSTWSVNSSHTITLPQRFSIELSGWYNALQYNGSKRFEGFGSVNVGMKKELGSNGALQLAVTDIFKSIHYTNRYGTLTHEAFDIKSHVTYLPESAHAQIIRLTYTYTLGKASINRPSRGSDIKDERDRI